MADARFCENKEKENQKNHWDKWLIDLSPSKALHKQYKNGKISWDVFSQRFRDEISNNERSMELCGQLAKESLNKNITLLCFEDDEHYVIGRLLEKSVNKSRNKSYIYKNTRSLFKDHGFIVFELILFCFEVLFILQLAVKNLRTSELFVIS